MRPSTSWTAVARAAAVVTLLGAAVIHASVVDEHASVWIAEAVFFAVLGTAEGSLAAAIAARPSQRVYGAPLGLSGATVALWAVSRTVGVPVGPQAWRPEAVGQADVIATLLEVTTAAVLA